MSDRLSLNWLSPMPPEPSGIGNYATHVVPNLKRHADVHVFTGASREPSSSAPDWSAAPAGAATPATLNGSDASLYHLGNNVDCHAAIYQAYLHCPDIVVLHDLSLQHLFAGYYMDRLGRPDLYIEIMHRYYGEDGLEAAEKLLHGELTPDCLSSDFPLYELAVERASGVVVHSDAALQALAGLNVPVVRLDLPFPATPRTAMSSSARESSAEPVKLIMFGYLGRNRRLETILEVLSRLPERDRFRLDILGRIPADYDLSGRIRHYGLENTVRVRGFVTNEELEAALDKADLALNLRYPTMGEASASQLRIWDHCLPSIVSDIDWYADLSDGTVFKVRPEREEADLMAHLRAYLADPGSFREAGRLGRKVLEKAHTPARYAERLAEFVREVRRLRPARALFDLVPAIAHAIEPWIDTDDELDLLEGGFDRVLELAEDE